MPCGSIELKVVQGDIIQLDVEAIICPIDPKMTGDGGIYGVLKKTGILADVVLSERPPGASLIEAADIDLNPLKIALRQKRPVDEDILRLLNFSIDQVYGLNIEMVLTTFKTILRDPDFYTKVNTGGIRLPEKIANFLEKAKNNSKIDKKMDPQELEFLNHGLLLAAYPHCIQTSGKTFKVGETKLVKGKKPDGTELSIIFACAINAYNTVERDAVKQAIGNALQVADNNGLQRVATPLFGSAKAKSTYGIMCWILINSLKELGQGKAKNLKEVTLSLYNAAAYSDCVEQLMHLG